MHVVPPSEENPPHNFAWWRLRRWETTDHLVMVGQNDVNDHFFLLDPQGVRRFCNQGPEPITGNDPITRAGRLLKRLDKKWYHTSVIEHHSTASAKNLCAHYHIVVMVGFLEPQFESEEVKQKVGYTEFRSRQDINFDLVPRPARIPLACALNLLESRRFAA